MEDKNHLSIPAIEDVKELNKEEDLELTPEEMRKLAKQYTEYWQQWDGLSKKIPLKTFVYDQLYLEGHPKGLEYKKSLHDCLLTLQNLKEKFQK